MTQQWKAARAAPRDSKNVHLIFTLLLVPLLVSSAVLSYGADQPTRSEAENAMKRATRYFLTHVATHGGYLWTYSLDLSERAGEGKATATQIWVQPPGTPAVGLAYLEAYKATGDHLYLDAATSAARALVWGQLQCGGWDYLIDFSPAAERKWYYYHSVNKRGKKGKRNTGTFDDNDNQSALLCLMEVDKLTGDPEIHAAVERGIAFFLKAQFPNGAWPQRYPLASKGYSRYYTFNDGAINDCISVMWRAWEIYGRKDCRESALKGGHFIIASQLKPPQAGWAQQYDYDLRPAPARWFEPAACCSLVTVRNIQTLVDLYLATGDDDFLKPIPPAVAWLRRSQIKDNLWARFYELKTNRPIYVTKDGKVSYSIKNVRPGYSWQGSYGTRSAIARYRKVVEMGRDAYLKSQAKPLSPRQRRERARAMSGRVREIINSLDPQGRWVTDGMISCQTFISNIRTLSEYVRLLSDRH